MRKALSALLIILWFAPASAQDFAARADKYLSAYAGRGEFMGAAPVARGGRVLFEKG